MGFYTDINIGKSGEHNIYKYLLNHPSTLNLIDVSKDEWFQQFDIDFIQITKDRINKIEVKTDRIADKTGNMIYEVCSDKRIYSKGCFEKTEADYIFYYLINNKTLYIFDTKELKEWVFKNKCNLNLTPMGDNAFGYIIPLNKLKNISIKERI